MRHTASTSRTSTQEPPFYSIPGIKHQYPYSILETAILADHMVKVEPRGLYGERSTGGVDGLVDIIKQGPAEPSGQRHSDGGDEFGAVAAAESLVM